MSRRHGQRRSTSIRSKQTEFAYRARHDDDQLCYAFFDRSTAALREKERKSDLDEDWFWQVAMRYGFGLAPG